MLVDTNAVLWMYEDSERLGPTARDLITSAPAVYLSSVSIAEIAIKHQLGRLDLPGGDDFPASLRAMGLRDLPLTAQHARDLHRLPELTRHDPFDRLLLAQAMADQIPLVTGDSKLLALGRDWIIDAGR